MVIKAHICKALTEKYSFPFPSLCQGEPTGLQNLWRCQCQIPDLGFLSWGLSFHLTRHPVSPGEAETQEVRGRALGSHLSALPTPHHLRNKAGGGHWSLLLPLDSDRFRPGFP